MPIRFIHRLLMRVIATGPALGNNPANAKPAAKVQRPNRLPLLADNWAWPHARSYGDKSVQTPTIDQIALDLCRDYFFQGGRGSGERETIDLDFQRLPSMAEG